MAYSGNICVWVVSCNECGGLTVRATLSQHKESHGSHGNFYEGEQEQCCSLPVGALYGGLRISQWHKLCWSRAGVTLAGTTGQLSLSIFFSGPTCNPCLPPPHLHTYNRVFCFLFWFLLFFNYSLPCWELLSLQGPVLSRGESTPHISALVQCTLQMALKPEGYITWIMWSHQPETKLNLPCNLVCTVKIPLPLLLARFGLQ